MEQREAIDRALAEWDILPALIPMRIENVTEWLIRFMGPAMEDLRRAAEKGEERMMNGKEIDTVREAFEKWISSPLDKPAQDFGMEYGDLSATEGATGFYAGYLAALSAIDPEAPGNEALVEKVITFFNNRVTIGETEDDCGDLVSVLELDKDFRSDLANMLSVIDPEAIGGSFGTSYTPRQRRNTIGDSNY